MTLVAVIVDALNARKNRVLRYAEAALPESQYRAYRGLLLDEFGRNGLEGELARIVADFERQGTASGRHTHAGKEVPHD
jgi:hypothetical protein